MQKRRFRPLPSDDARTITIRYPDGRGERLELHPKEDGSVDVVEKVLQNDGTYREIGHDVAASVTVE